MSDVHEKNDQQHDVDTHLPGDAEDPNGGITWVLGLACTFILIAVLIASNALFFQADSIAVHNKEVTVRSSANRLMRAERVMQLEQEPHWEAWTDIHGELAGERTLHVDMDTAVNIVVKRWGGSAK